MSPERLGAAGRRLLALLLLGCGSAHGIEPAHLVSGFGRAVVVIETAALRCVRVNAWVAATDRQRSQGLMHVESMAEFEGMLFLFAGEALLTMWMQNTLIPLDMLFLRSDSTIASIAADTVPLSTRRIHSGEPVAAVLEVNAGFSARWNIVPGNRVQVSATTPAEAVSVGAAVLLWERLQSRW